MTISYQREYLDDQLITETENLRLEHNESIKAEKQLKPDWDRYKILENHGGFVIYSARTDDSMIGYACFIISTNPHNMDEVQAYQDSIYVKPLYRKKGVGSTLLRFTEDQLKKFGVSRVSQMVLDIYDFGKVLTRSGYQSIGRIYAKDI